MSDNVRQRSSAAHPIKTVWLHPRSTIRQIVANDPEYGVFLLAALTGAVVAPIDILDRVSQETMPMAVLIFSLAAVGGAVKAFFMLFTGGWLLAWAGRRFGGVARTVDIRAAMAWANVPLAIGLLIWWLLLFAGSVMEIDGGLHFTGALFIMLAAWSYLLLAINLAAIQRFSVWKSALILIGLWAMLGVFFWSLVWLGTVGITSALENSFLRIAP